MKKKKFLSAYGEASRKKQQDLLINYNNVKKKTLGRKRKRLKYSKKKNKNYYDYSPLKNIKNKKIFLEEEENPNDKLNINNNKSSEISDFEFNKVNNSQDTYSYNNTISDILNNSNFSLNESEEENNNLNKDKTAPWLSQKTKNLNGILRLHYEILDFYEYIKPNIEEKEIINEIIKTIKNLIKTNFNNKYTVKLFGSNSTDLSLPNSDIDLCIFPKNNSNIKKILPALQINILKQIQKILWKTDKFINPQLINAKTPIIKVKYNYSILISYDIDISFGHKNGYAATKIINKILDNYPYIKPIILLLKYFLKQKKLNQTYTGGISSFCLFSLVYAYILYLNKERDNNSILTLGNILIGFLDFYCFKFNFEKVGISIRYGGFFYKRTEKKFNDNSHNGKNHGLLSLENFQDIEQDVGGNCFRFSEVLGCFKFMYNQLKVCNNDNEESYLLRFLDKDKFLSKRKISIS